MRSKGFTLVELIIAVSIMTVLGLIFTDTLTQALRGQVKVKAVNQVKQNGQVVLDRLINEIHDSEKVICVGSPGGTFKNTLVVFKNGAYDRFRLVPATGSKNGYINKDTFQHEEVADVTPDLLCSASTQYAGRITNLTDTDPANGVSLLSDDLADIFSLDSKNGYHDVVTIRFRATAGVRAGSAYEATVKEGGILFITTVQIRGTK